MNKLHFKISTGLKSIIGKDLITDEFIAIYELVKNSFDAYATRVDIRFGKDEIIIQDNGKGMSFEDLKDKWLFLAYSAKQTGDEDGVTTDRDYRSNLSATRYYAGAKGIGRFSSDRLGSKLTLYSKKSSAVEVEKLKVDWGRFEQDSKEEFESVEVQHTTLSLAEIEHELAIEGYSYGTIVNVRGLRSIWDRDKLKHLRRALTKLINPFDENTSNSIQGGFRIFLHAPDFASSDKSEQEEYNRVNGEVTNSIIELVKLKSTSIHVKITNARIRTTLEDRGVLIYEIEEDNTTYDRLENVEIYLYFLNTAAKTNFTRRMGLRPIDFGSVFLFKNGFRIYPFGEPGDDRLGIDERKQQGYNRFLGSRDLLGRIEIRGDAEGLDFKETSSRDGGLVATDSYYQLKNSVREIALVPLEKYVAGILWHISDRGSDDLMSRRDADRNDESPSIIKNIDIKASVADLLLNLTRGKKNAVLLKYDSSLLEVLDEEATPDVSELIDKLYAFAEKAQDKFVMKSLGSAKQHIKYLENKAEAEQLLREQEAVARRIAEKVSYEAQARTRKAEEDAKAEHMANTLLRSTIAPGLEEIVNLHHLVGISAGTIATLLKTLQSIAKGKESLPTTIVLDMIDKIAFENNKIHVVTQFATKANFVMDSEEITVDLARFLEDYLNNISTGVFVDQVRINVKNLVKGKILKSFKPIEISMLIDNLVSNACKARAKNIAVSLEKTENAKLTMHFADDGHGIKSEIREQIFKFGYTTTRGSGLGLHHVKQILSKMEADIFLDTTFEKGTQFIITF